MKIDYAIMSSDSTPMYLDFWPHISKVWKLRFGITPVLVLIEDKENMEVSEEYGIVHRIKPSKDYPLTLQSQMARFWYPHIMPEKISIISDIDMFPVSRGYFINSIEKYDDGLFLHINPENLHGNNPYFPACYIIAKGKVFTDIMELDDDFYSILKDLKNEWTIDEKNLTDKIYGYPDQSIFRFIHRPSGLRLNRIDPTWWYNTGKIKAEMWLDVHSWRPYNQYKNIVDIMVNDLINS